MRKSTLVVIAGILAAAANLNAKSVTVALQNAKGESAGTATISENKKGVLVHLHLRNLPPGEHAAHFHQNPKCEPGQNGQPDFASAGGHFNPDMKHHGLDNPEGPHAGDMPNFTATPKGRAKGILVDTRVNLGSDSHSLFSNGGTALVIHATKDDMHTDPAGNAGARIACGVITKP